MLCVVCSTGLYSLDLHVASEQNSVDQNSPIQLAWNVPPASDYGISTTLEEGRGNWYIKKQHTKAALEVKQKIEAIVARIIKEKDPLEEMQALVEGQVGQFYAAAGFAPSELSERLSLIVQQIEKSGSQSSLTEQDRASIAEAEIRKKEVAALKGDLELLVRLQNTVVEAVRVAQREIARGEISVQKAAELYDEIDMTISDERAEKLLALLRADEKALEALERYLKQELPQYGEQTTVVIAQTIAALNTKIADLKAKGLSLEKRVQQEKQKQKPAPVALAEPEPWYRLFWSALHTFFVRSAAFLGIKI